MRDDLESILTNLSDKLGGAETQFTEAHTNAGQAETNLVAVRQQYLAQARLLLEPAAAVTTRLEMGERQIREEMTILEGDLDGLDQDLLHRARETSSRMHALQEAVQSLGTVLQRVSAELLSEEERTKAALMAAHNRSVEALKTNHAALTTLDTYVREEYLPLSLAAHQQATLAHEQALDQVIRERVLPAIEAKVRELQTQITGALSELSLTSQALANDAQQGAEETMNDVAAGAAAIVTSLNSHVQESAQALHRVVLRVEEQLHTEQSKELELLAAGAIAGKQARQLQTIPPTLRDVLVKARVIPASFRG